MVAIDGLGMAPITISSNSIITLARAMKVVFGLLLKNTVHRPADEYLKSAIEVYNRFQGTGVYICINDVLPRMNGETHV